MEIKRIPINKINPASYNPRADLQPGEPVYEKLKKEMGEFGLVEPLVWNKRTGNLIGGHQRLKILKEQGHQAVEVSVVDLDERKEKILNLALNRIIGNWDPPKLKNILEELDSGDFNIELTGFDEGELENLFLADEPWEIEDILEELNPGSGVAKPLWVVLRCDAEQMEALEKTLTDLKIKGLKIEKSYQLD